MRTVIAILLLLATLHELPAADATNQKVLRFLDKQSIMTSQGVDAVPKCIFKALQRWYEGRFVLVKSPKDFPRFNDIRRAGDGRFCLIFFSHLEAGTHVLSFKDYASIGLVNRVLVFRSSGQRCVVFADYAFADAVTSVRQLRKEIRAAR